MGALGGASGRKAVRAEWMKPGRRGKQGPVRRHQVDGGSVRPGERQGCGAGQDMSGFECGRGGATETSEAGGGGVIVSLGLKRVTGACACPEGGGGDVRREKMGLDLSRDLEGCQPLPGKREARRKVLVP